MRLGTSYRCPECLQFHPALDVLCAQCRVAIVDEHGETALSLESHVVAPPFVPTSAGTIVWRSCLPAVGVAGLGMFAPEALVVTVPAGLALWAVVVIVQIVIDRSRQAAARVAREAERLEASLKVDSLRDDNERIDIVELPADEICRVRGRVKVLDVVQPGPKRIVAQLYESAWRRMGRFMVIDETGEAMIDDDAVELWSASEPGDPIDIAEGDIVEVVGRGRYHRVGQGADGYRGGKEITQFVFEGERDLPLHLIKVEPSEA